MPQVYVGKGGGADATPEAPRGDDPARVTATSSTKVLDDAGIPPLPTTSAAAW